MPTYKQCPSCNKFTYDVKRKICSNCSKSSPSSNSIRIIDYIKKVNAIMVFLNHAVGAFTANREVFLEQLTRGFPQILSDPKLFVQPLSDEFKEEILAKLAKEQEIHVESYIPLILNQALVMLCTIFEMFLTHVVERTFTFKKEILIGVSEEKTIDLKKIIDIGNFEGLIEHVKQREVKALQVLDNVLKEKPSEKFEEKQEEKSSTQKVHNLEVSGRGR